MGRSSSYAVTSISCACSCSSLPSHHPCVRGTLKEALQPPRTRMNMYKPSRTHPNISEHTSDSQTHMNLLWRMFMCLLLSSDSSHQSGMISINMGITCIYFILTLSDLTSMGTTSGYIVTQDLYIVWGLARETLENSLWFSLARCESFFCFSLVILLFGFPLQVSSIQTLIIRLPLHPGLAASCFHPMSSCLQWWLGVLWCWWLLLSCPSLPCHSDIAFPHHLLVFAPVVSVLSSLIVSC
jgi:hypothetical protein